MGYLGQEIGKLGFGLMRLPMIGSEVDIEQTKQMVDLFMEKGFTYFDTAYGYIEGKSEAAVKVALVDRYPRESFQLATKLPAWAGAKNAQEAKEMFWTSLRRTGAGYFDFYLLHNLGEGRTEVFDEYGIWDFLQEQKAAGLIKHLGFSMHATAEHLEEILTKHPEMEFVQLQINYADWESNRIQSRKCYEVARRFNKPVIIMEPVKGGALASLPENAKEIFTAADGNASPASWAVRYAASLEGVITVLSGMSNTQQMTDNLSYMVDFKPLSADERAVIENVLEKLQSLVQISCTDCKYCVKGCPAEIPIPTIFFIMNNYLLYNNMERFKGSYYWDVKMAKKGMASDCTQCGQCEKACPQSIRIIEELEKCAAVFE